MSDPYRPATAGDALLAETWNEMQKQVRDHVCNHRHTGAADDGTRLTGASIDPGSALEVAKVTSLSVKAGDLTTSGAASLQGGVGVAGSANFTGTLSVTAMTKLDGGVAVKGGVTVDGPLNINQVPRSGAHPPRVLGAYITGDFTEASGVEFRHTNATQGIGFGSNTIYATGSNPEQSLFLKAQPSGRVEVLSPLSVTGMLTLTGGATISGPLHVTTASSFSGGLKVTGKNVIELGAGQNKESSSGKIGYDWPDEGILSIYGAGTNTENRRVKVWAKGGTEIVGPLAVSGSLTIGQNHAMSSPGQAIRTVWGYVESNGNVTSGKGFTVRPDGKVFVVTFSTAFAEKPCVLVTRVIDHNHNSLHNGVVYAIEKDSCRIKLGNERGDADLWPFCFIAIGP